MNRVVAGLKLWVSDMWKKERHIFDIYDGTIASDEMVRNVLSARKAEEDAKAEFFYAFITTGAATDRKRAEA